MNPAFVAYLTGIGIGSVITLIMAAPYLQFRSQSRNPVTREFNNELGNRIRIVIAGPVSVSENVLTKRETLELRSALMEFEI